MPADPHPAPGAVPPPTAVTILDLDRTITRRGTYTPFLLYAARRIAPWRLLVLPVVLLAMLAYKGRLLRRETLKQFMHRTLLGRGIEAARITQIAEAFAGRVVGSGLNPGILALVARERRAGRMIVVATAAHRFYAEPIARRLGIEHVIATESVRDGDVLRSAISGENCYGPAKVQAVIDFLTAHGLERSATTIRFYSDDISDLPLFEISDEPIGFNPCAALRQTCAQRGWPVHTLV